MNARLNLLLLLALLASALYLVHIQYQSRKLFTELDRARAQAQELETEHRRLLVEKRAQATPLRIEQMARAQLGMRAATPAITQYLYDPPAGAGALQAAAATQSGGAAQPAAKPRAGSAPARAQSAQRRAGP